MLLPEFKTYANGWFSLKVANVRNGATTYVVGYLDPAGWFGRPMMEGFDASLLAGIGVL